MSKSRELIDVKRNESAGKYNSTLDPGSGDTVQAYVYYNSDGTIDEKKTYTDYYYKQLHKDDEVEDDEVEDDEDKNKKEKPSKEKEGCLTKLWKAPFRLLWWLVKKALIILSLGILSGLLDGDDDKN